MTPARTCEFCGRPILRDAPVAVHLGRHYHARCHDRLRDLEEREAREQAAGPASGEGQAGEEDAPPHP